MEPGPEDGSFPQPGYGEFSQDESKSYLTAWKDLRRPTGMDKATWDAILDYTLSERTWIDDMTRKVGTAPALHHTCCKWVGALAKPVPVAAGRCKPTRSTI
jgi:hypothetical protein